MDGKRETSRLVLIPPSHLKMSRNPPKSGYTYCANSPFTPSQLVQDEEKQARALARLAENDLYGASTILFDLPTDDDYTYYAMSAVKLAQVQSAVNLGRANGLHAWYRAEDGSPVSQEKGDVVVRPFFFFFGRRNSLKLSPFCLLWRGDIMGSEILRLGAMSRPTFLSSPRRRRRPRRSRTSGRMPRGTRSAARSRPI